MPHVEVPAFLLSVAVSPQSTPFSSLAVGCLSFPLHCCPSKLDVLALHLALSYSVSLLLPHSKKKTVNPPPFPQRAHAALVRATRPMCSNIWNPRTSTGHHSLELVLAPCDLPQLFHGSGLLHLHRHGRTLSQHHVETLSLPVSLAPLFCAG